MTAVLGASLTLSEGTATTATGHLFRCVNSTRRGRETGRQVARAAAGRAREGSSRRSPGAPFPSCRARRLRRLAGPARSASCSQPRACADRQTAPPQTHVCASRFPGASGRPQALPSTARKAQRRGTGRDWTRPSAGRTRGTNG